VDISWTAFKGFSRNHIVRAAEIASRQSDTRLAALQNRFSLDLGQLFFAWELAYHNLAVHKTHMRQLSEHAGRIRELHHGGLRARSKVLEAEARLEAAKVQLVRSEHKADSLRLELCSLLNIGDSAIVPSSYDFQRLTVGVPQMRQQPDSNRNELAILAMDRERTALARKALTAERYPALLLNAGYRYANPGLYLGYNQQMNYGTLGLSLRWTIYDGMKHWARIRKLEQREEIIDTRRAKQYAEWEKRAQLARKQLENAHRIMAAAQLSLKAARQLEKDLVNALNAGVVVSDEYLNALAAVAQAQFEVARAEALKKGALLRLEFALGETIRF
jgi:outer membrane protein TolC